MELTKAQWQLILDSEDNCIRCYAFMPELSHDVMPHAEPVAQMQIDWYLAARTVYYD